MKTLHVYGLISLIQLLYILLTLKLPSEMAHLLCSQTNRLVSLPISNNCGCMTVAIYIPLHSAFLHAHMCMWYYITCSTQEARLIGRYLQLTLWQQPHELLKLYVLHKDFAKHLVGSVTGHDQ